MWSDDYGAFAELTNFFLSGVGKLSALVILFKIQEDFWTSVTTAPLGTKDGNFLDTAPSNYFTLHAWPSFRRHEQSDVNLV